MKKVLIAYHRITKSTNTDINQLAMISRSNIPGVKFEYFEGRGKKIRIQAAYFIFQILNKFVIDIFNLKPLQRRLRTISVRSKKRKQLYDFVYGYYFLPINSRYPVIYSGGIITRSDLRKNYSNRDIDEFNNYQLNVARYYCYKYHVHTKVEQEYFAKQGIEVFYAPFFLKKTWSITNEENIRSNKRTFVFVGNLAKAKNIEWAIRIAHAYSEKINLIVVSNFLDGEVSTKDYINVEFRSNLTSEELKKIFRQTHYLLFTSQIDTYGLVILEAMSQGCIPIIPSFEVQRELISDSMGYQYEPYDYNSLESEIERILRNDFDVDLSKRCKTHFRKNYGYEATLRYYEEIFR